MLEPKPDRILWQPDGLYKGRGDFRILLDRGLALEMLDASLLDGPREQLQHLAMECQSEYGLSRMPQRDALKFYENTGLLTGIELGSGRQLNLEGSVRDLRDTEGLVVYNSHNGGSVASPALIALFDLWVSYVDIIKSIPDERQQSFDFKTLKE
jgi:hypothetical protein